MLSALVIGSLAPDFHYFLNLAPRGHFGHSFKGIFIFCLPAGLAVLWIFQHVMKLPLISLAPVSHQQRLVTVAKPFSWSAKRFWLVLVSLLVGAISHLVWDAFTHERGFVVRNVPDMRIPLEEFGTERPLYNVLQHGSSLVGLALLVFWYWRWFQRTPPQPVPLYLQTSNRKRHSILGCMLVLVTSSAAIYAYFDSYHLASVRLFVGTFVITSMSMTFLAALGFSLWWRQARNQAVTPH